jgi:quinol monooxygenase YgiN
MAEQHTSRTDDMDDTAIYVVTYFEVMPASATEAAVLFRQYSEASRTDAGLVELEVLQQCSRPDHFATVAAWQDQTSFEAHGGAAHTRAMREGLETLRSSPYDERLHHGLVLATTPASRPTAAIYAVTHADAIPPAKDDAMRLLKQLAEISRHDDGSIRFEVLQQRSRPNHFTIVEIWRDQKALDTHVIAAHTRQFREQFQPMSGSLYDERLYTALE